MTVHFMHIGKTGGSAIKRALRKSKLADFKVDASRSHVTPYGPIRLYKAHRFRLRHLPPDDHVFFCLRDPLRRYVSGFNSRLRKGQPGYYVEWSDAERDAFEVFSTPQRLAKALGSDDEEQRRRAEAAMKGIRHMRPMTRWVGTADHLRRRAHQVVYIGRQETLDADWEQLKAILDLPRGLALPSDEVGAHRGDPFMDTSLDDAAVESLREWYRDDYELLAYCEQLRSEHGWGVAPPAGESAAPAREPDASDGEPVESAPRPRRPRRTAPKLPAEVAPLAHESRRRLELWDGFVRSIDARRVVEVGVYRGAFAEHILAKCPAIDTYFMIDPWEHLDEWNKPANRDNQTFEQIYKEAMRRTHVHHARRVVMRGRTADAIDRIPDESLDFAYVDGDHTLRGITTDLIRVYPKIRAGGWIGGDDFSESIWQHGEKFEPTLVFPFAVYFAEAVGVPIFGLPRRQFLIQKLSRLGFRFEDLTGTYGDRELLSQVRARKASAPQPPAAKPPQRRRPRTVVRRVLRRLRR